MRSEMPMSKSAAATRARVSDDEPAPAKVPGHNAGRNMGGICDIESLRNHCRVTEDGCWLYAGKVGGKTVGRSPSLYLRQLHKTTSLGSAVHYVRYGKLTPPGLNYIATCGHATCCNPDHRRRTNRGGHMAQKARAGDLPADWGLANLVHKPRKLTDAQVVEIFYASGRHVDLGKVYGVLPEYISNIKQGKVRRAAVLGAQGVAGMFSQLLAANDGTGRKRA